MLPYNNNINMFLNIILFVIVNKRENKNIIVTNLNKKYNNK
jgi:hypothetical protein